MLLAVAQIQYLQPQHLQNNNGCGANGTSLAAALRGNLWDREIILNRNDVLNQYILVKILLLLSCQPAPNYNA